MISEIARFAVQLYELRTRGQTTSPIPRASRLLDAMITERQLRLHRGQNGSHRAYLSAARWWELEALRGYESSWRSVVYARNQRLLAELARIHGPGDAQPPRGSA